MIFIVDDYLNKESIKGKDAIICRTYEEAIVKWDDSIFYEYVLIDYDLTYTLKIKQEDFRIIYRNNNIVNDNDFKNYMIKKYKDSIDNSFNVKTGLDFYNFIKNKKNFYKIIYSSIYHLGNKFDSFLKDPRVKLILLKDLNFNNL